MKINLSYCRLLILLVAFPFSLTAAAQTVAESDTIVITPKGNYSTITDTVEFAAGENDSVVTMAENIEEAGAGTYSDTLLSQYRPIPEDTIRRINEDKGFYYKNYFDSLLRASQNISNKSKKIKVPDSSFFSSLFKLIIWIGAISLLAYLVYKLFLSNSSMFSRNRKNYDTENIKVDEENPENPGALVEQAVREGNYRFAVRYLYLQTLMNLAEKKYVQTGSDKTNYQYVSELRNQPFVNEFSSLTLQYEYVWYGGYDLDEDIFDQIYLGFKNFNKTIGR